MKFYRRKDGLAMLDKCDGILSKIDLALSYPYLTAEDEKNLKEYREETLQARLRINELISQLPNF